MVPLHSHVAQPPPWCVSKGHTFLYILRISVHLSTVSQSWLVQKDICSRMIIAALTHCCVSSTEVGRKQCSSRFGGKVNPLADPSMPCWAGAQGNWALSDQLYLPHQPFPGTKFQHPFHHHLRTSALSCLPLCFSPLKWKISLHTWDSILACFHPNLVA